MHPVLFQTTVFSRELIIGTYGAITVAALISGILVFMLSGKVRGFTYNECLNYSLILAASAMLGASAAGFLLFLPERITYGFFDFPPVLVSWGGITGGIAAGLLISHFWDIEFLKLADISGPAFLTGIGIGRIGCNFGGCCFGIHTEGFFSITFTHPYAPASLMFQPLIPTQLLSAGFLIITGIIFFILVRYIKINGLISALISICYSIFRFIIEYFRADSRKFLYGFSDAQIFSIFFFTAGIFIIMFIFKTKYKHYDIKNEI